MRIKIFLSLLFCILDVFITCADAFQAKILPSEIRPGDVFSIKITGAKTPEPPAAVLNNKQFNFNNCGEGCFIALGVVDIETRPGIYRIKLHIGKKMLNLKLAVRRISFPTLFLTLPEDKVSLSPEDMKRVEREAERLNTIWKTASERFWEGSFMLPLENDISTLFGTKRIINRKKISIHKGTDMRGKEGEEVKASNRGRVVLAEELFFGGNTIILDHGQGIFTIYMHLSAFNVKPEDIVSRGEIVGFVGSTGRSSGPHLHFGVKVMEASADPVSLVKLKL